MVHLVKLSYTMTCDQPALAILQIVNYLTYLRHKPCNNNNNNNNNNIQTAIGSAGAVTEMAATRKSTKYGALESQYCFQPIALESLGPLNSDARQFLSDLGRRISRSSGDDRETSFLFQRISVLLFRFNSVLLHDGFVLDDRPEQ